MRHLCKWSALGICMVLALLTLLLVLPGLLGIHPLLVQSGSMEPEYPVGSMIYVKSTEGASLAEGDVATFYLPDEETLVTQINEREFVVAGAMSLDDLNDYLELDEKGLRLESEDYNSIGGIIIGLLDHLPEVGEEAVTENGIRLIADSVEKNRINEVHIILPEPEQEETPEES